MKGWKTWTATIGYGICEGLKALLPEHTLVIELFQNAVLIPLGAVGVAHKIEKSRF